MKYLFAVVLVCAYGVLKELRPVEAFLYEYFLTRDVTESELISQVAPYWTYSYLVFLVPTLLLCDTLRYRPILYLECASYIACWAVIIWSTGVHWMQFNQFLYGIATATEVAYYSYVYGLAGKERYQTLTSYARAAVLTGRCISFAIAQVIYTATDWEYQVLNYISLACLLAGTICALCLPAPSYAPHLPFKLYFSALKRQFLSNYSQAFIVKWSIWWAIATCGAFQIQNYVQPLWHVVYVESHEKNETTGVTTTVFSTTSETSDGGRGFERINLWNGVTYAINALLGAGVAFSVQYIRCIQWKVAGDLVLAVASAVSCAVLFAASTATNLISAYVCYVIFMVCYQCVITIATFNVASEVTESAFGLVVGCNTFMALVLQTILTVVVVDESGLQMTERDQFLVYGTIYAVLTFGFTLSSLYVVYQQNGFKPFVQNSVVDTKPAAEATDYGATGE